MPVKPRALVVTPAEKSRFSRLTPRQNFSRLAGSVSTLRLILVTGSFLAGVVIVAAVIVAVGVQGSQVDRHVDDVLDHYDHRWELLVGNGVVVNRAIVADAEVACYWLTVDRDFVGGHHLDQVAPIGFLADRGFLCVGVLKQMKYILTLIQRCGHLSRCCRGFEIFKVHVMLPITSLTAV